MTASRWLFAFPAVGAIAGVAAIGIGVGATRSRTHDFQRSPDAMLSVPGGAFVIDELEVSVADYALCVRAGACRLYTTSAGPTEGIDDRNGGSSACRGGRPDRAAETMNCVDWFEASAYCKWAGKRLPTLEEWTLGVGSKHPARSSELHRVTSEKGWFAGEWTASAAAAKEAGPWPELRRLGSWRTDPSVPERLWTLRDDWYPVSVRSPWIGFRCAR
jgi:Sulfatase-modifying factor enzyme 1